MLKKSPSPIPTISLPAINIDMFIAPDSKAAPRANQAEPMATARLLPIESESAPENREANVAEISTEETTIPRVEGDMLPPKYAMNCGIVVTGPMTPVSNLKSRVNL